MTLYSIGANSYLFYQFKNLPIPAKSDILPRLSIVIRHASESEGLTLLVG